jgi:hypothetical protein
MLSNPGRTWNRKSWSDSGRRICSRGRFEIILEERHRTEDTEGREKRVGVFPRIACHLRSERRTSRFNPRAKRRSVRKEAHAPARFPSAPPCPPCDVFLLKRRCQIEGQTSARHRQRSMIRLGAWVRLSVQKNNCDSRDDS